MAYFMLYFLQSTGEAQEVLSLRQGPVRLVRMLKTPLEGINYITSFPVLLVGVRSLSWKATT